MSDDSTGLILAAIAQVDGKVSQLEVKVSQLDDRMAQVEGKVTQLDGKVTQLDGRLARVEGKVTQLDATISRTRVDVMDRIDRLQNTFSTMKEDIVVNFGNADRVERAARNAQEETRALAEVVTAMQRQIRTLADRVDGIELRGNGHAREG